MQWIDLIPVAGVLVPIHPLPHTALAAPADFPRWVRIMLSSLFQDETCQEGLCLPPPWMQQGQFTHWLNLIH